MYNSCPVDLKTVSNTVVRLNAAQISFLLIITLYTGWWLVPMFLAADFLVRLSPVNNWSPIRFISYLIYRSAGLPENPVDRAPKRFAASIGVIFSVASALFLLLGWEMAGMITLGIFLACALLEAVFDFCLGCVVYFWLVRAGLVGNSKNDVSAFQSAG